MDLSILVCSLISRRPLRDRLVRVLNPQMKPNIEIKIHEDTGSIPIGAKRNLLVNMAQGKYVCFVDDDDLVATNYVAKILEAIRTDPDCVGIEGEITTNGRNPKKFIHSLKYDHWFEKDNIYYRNPNHLNPIRRSIVQQIPFPALSFGEDADFSKRVLPLLKTESHIEGTLYHYLYMTNKRDGASIRRGRIR